MRLVVDCNVVFSAAWNDGLSRQVLLAAVGRLSTALSPAILAEYRRVASYHVSPERRARQIDLVGVLAEAAVIVPDEPCPFELPDEDDLPYLAAALHAEADLLLTGNAKHFPEATYGRVRIVSVRELAAELGVGG